MSIDDKARSPQPDAPGAPEGSAYSVRPLDGSTWDAFAELVERNGGVFGGCWCMGHHQTPDGGSYHQVRGIGKKATKEALVRSGQAHAALVFDEEGLAQGWAKYGRIDELPILAQHRRAYEKQPSARPGWRIACFYTDKNRRREGIARAALGGALDLIQEAGGGTVESIPRSPAAGSHTDGSCSRPPWSSSRTTASSGSVSSASGPGWCAVPSCPERVRHSRMQPTQGAVDLSCDNQLGGRSGHHEGRPGVRDELLVWGGQVFGHSTAPPHASLASTI